MKLQGVERMQLGRNTLLWQRCALYSYDFALL